MPIPLFRIQKNPQHLYTGYDAVKHTATLFYKTEHPLLQHPVTGK